MGNPARIATVILKIFGLPHKKKTKVGETWSKSQALGKRTIIVSSEVFCILKTCPLFLLKFHLNGLPFRWGFDFEQRGGIEIEKTGDEV